MQTVLRAALAAAFLFCGVGMVHASQCAPRTALVTALAERYGERLAFTGLVNETTRIETFASGKGTFTALQTRVMRASSGVMQWSCIVSAGRDFERHEWQRHEDLKPGRDS